MRKIMVLFLAIFAGNLSSCAPKIPADFVLVEGGEFKNSKSNYFGNGELIPAFYLGKYEVTQQEWVAVMNTNPSKFRGGNLPVETVSWYDCVEYCNRRSAKEGLAPYYTINKTEKDAHNLNELDDVKWVVTANPRATGYRLPTEAEWEYAASGGQRSQRYAYSGSNELEKVAWYWKNAGDKFLTVAWAWPVLEKNHNRTRPVGSKAANELGVFDLSGNVREWCWDLHEGHGMDDPPGRVWKGGGWIGAEFCCEPAFHASLQANGTGPDQGFRVCRSQ